MQEQTYAEPTLEQWEALYAIAEKFKALAPWKKMHDFDLVMVELPDEEEPFFCSIIGSGGESYGVSIHPGYAAFAGLMLLIQEDPDDMSIQAITEQRAISCQFGSRDEVDPQDREIMKKLNLRFRGKNQWTFFRSMRPGYFPWHIDADEAALLLKVLPQLLPVCEGLLAGTVPVCFEEGEYLRRFYSEESGQWWNVPYPVSAVPAAFPFVSVKPADEVHWARMKRKKKTRNAIEIDFSYLPMPFHVETFGLTRMMHLTAFADHKNGDLLGQHLAQPDEDPALVPSEMLLSYIDECEKPSAVYVRNEWQAGYVRSICKQMGIRLCISEDVIELNELFRSMLDHFADMDDDGLF